MLALLSALLTDCRPFCGLKTDAWSVRCSWASCGECVPCPAAPTPPPSPTADCKRYCVELTHPLARRCTWNGCGGCSECYGSPPAPFSGDMLVGVAGDTGSGDGGSADMIIGDMESASGEGATNLATQRSVTLPPFVELNDKSNRQSSQPSFGCCTSIVASTTSAVPGGASNCVGTFTLSPFSWSDRPTYQKGNSFLLFGQTQ